MLFVPPCVAAGLAIAVVLQKTGRWRRALLGIFLSAALTCPVAATILAYACFHYAPGSLAEWFAPQGPKPDGEYARPVITFAAVLCGWQYLGVVVAIFTVALRAPYPAGRDAALLDSDGGARTMSRLSMGALGPAILLAIMAGLAIAMKTFAQVFVVCGGADESRLYSVLSYLYVHALHNGSQGRSALALVGFWAAALFCITVICWLLSSVQRRNIVAEMPYPADESRSTISRAVGCLAAAAVLAPFVVGIAAMSRPTPAGYTDDLAPCVTNSILVAAFSTAGGVIFGSMAAFALTRLEFPGRKAFAAFFVVLAFVPAEVALVGQFEIFAGLKLIDTVASLALSHCALVLPMCILFIAHGFWRVPPELSMQSTLNGRTPPGTWLRVMVPAAPRTLAAVAGLAALISWNEFIFALALTRTSASRTIPVQMHLGFRNFGLCHPILILTVCSLLPAVIAAIALTGFFKTKRV